MTSPDAPLATVRTFGPSEIVTTVGLVSSLLIAVFGHDFGIGAQAQNIATVGVVVIPPFLGLIRAHKHGAAMQANAAVTVARLQQGGVPPKTPPPLEVLPSTAKTGSGRHARDSRGRYAAEGVTRYTGD